MRLCILFCLSTIFATFQAHEIFNDKGEIKIIWDRRPGTPSNIVPNVNSRLNFEPRLNFNDALEKFSNTLFQYAKEKQEGNFVISPLSANVLLSLAGMGARRTTRHQIETALSGSPRYFNEQTIRQYHDLIYNFTSGNDVLLKLVNKIYVNNQFSVKDQYKQLAKIIFNSSVEDFNFSNENQAVNAINSWVAEQTNNRIKDLIRSLDTDTTMVAINVIYFKGAWNQAIEFSTYDTRNATFFNNGKAENQILVETMTTDSNFKWNNLTELNATFVEIPYKGDDVVMLIVVPNEINGLEEVERNLQTLSLKELRQKGIMQNLILALPKFKIETAVDMKPLFEKMGMTSMFSPTDANFTAISDLGVYINNVMQKVNIEINEGGTEAAAAGFAKIVPLFLPLAPPLKVKVNRPFHFKIIKNTGDNDGIVLFAGNVCNFQ